VTPKLRRFDILCDEAARPPRDFRTNVIKTSKYTWVTFLPKNLVEQFSKMANVYFLIITFMQMIDKISISDGKPVMLLPLSFVIGVSMIKDIFEDYKRHRSDRAENFKMAEVYDRGQKGFERKHWQEIKVGDILRVHRDEYLPADIVLA
jgi:phospholipid-transporting ATPase